MRRYILVFSMLLLGALALSFGMDGNFARADSDCDGRIIITEIMPNPSSSDIKGEWIELYNTTNQDINLDGYLVSDVFKSPHEFVLPNGLIIKAKSYYVYYQNLKLNDKGKDGAVIFAPDKTSECKTDIYDGTEDGNTFAYNKEDDEWYWTSRSTPGTTNEFDPPKTSDDSDDSTAISEKNSCAGIIISELMPDPGKELSDANDEWIELHNTLNRTVKIGGCKLRDLRGSVKTYTIPNGKTIPAKGYAVFYSKDTPISMNNDEDGIALLSSGETVVFQTAIYKESEEGNSFAYNGEEWSWTSTPTPKAANVLTKVSDKDEKKKVKNQKKKKKDSAKNTENSSKSAEEVLGVSTGSEQPKTNDKLLGYFMIVFSFIFLVGYIGWLKKDYIYENIIQKFRKNI